MVDVVAVESALGNLRAVLRGLEDGATVDEAVDGLQNVITMLTGPVADDYMTLTPTGIVWLDKPPLDVATRAFDSLVNLHKAMPWLLGDMMNFMDDQGGVYEQMMSVTGLAYETLAQYKRVARAVPYDQRDSSRSYSFYKATAHLPAERRAEYEQAIHDGTITGGVQGVRAALQETGDSRPRAEKPQFSETAIVVEQRPDCPLCGGKLGKFACRGCRADITDLAWRLHDLTGELRAFFITGEIGGRLMEIKNKDQEGS